MGVYTTRSLRRQDRAMTEQDARLLLAEATCGVLCMENIDGGGYGIPINYAWDEEDSIYFIVHPLDTSFVVFRIIPGSRSLY